MTRPVNPEEFEALLALYALDALGDDERRRVEEHLARDAGARDLLGEFERVVVGLAHELGPPDHVWDRLARSVFPGEPQVPHPRRLVAQGRRPGRRVGGVLAGFAAAACIAALIAGVTLAASSGPSGSNLAGAARSAATTPGARLVALRGSDGIVVASAVVLPDGSGYLTSHLAHLASGRTYQLWALEADRAVSLGVLGPQPRVQAFTVAGPARRLVITDETAGGVTVTHETPSAAGDLPGV